MKRYVLFLLFLPVFFSLSAQDRPSGRKMPPALEMALSKMNMATIALKQLYIDTINEGKLADAAIKAMLEELDPHTSYTNAEETKKFNEPLNSNFEGIGVQFNILKDTLVVIQTISKGPSEKVGILPGDRIVSVNDTAIAGVNMPRDQIMKRLRGPKGTIVHVGVRRREVPEVLTFRITRDKIPLHSVDAAYMVRPGIGLIRISSFAVNTRKELDEAIAKLKKQGMKKLILDLQSNGGGYLEAACEVSSVFLPEGDLIVYTDGRAVPHKDYHAKGGGNFQKGDLVVLVDEYSASAAEIVSGAVQDQDRGVLIGRRTFGKGLVQRPVPLPDGSLIRITVSHYYTPAGRCIQKPYEKGKKKEYQEDVYNRYKVGELMHRDSIHFADSLKYKTLRKGRTVYGGGGVMPDIFIPLDTLKYTKCYSALSRKNCILENYMAYQDQHRKELSSKYKSFDKFNKEYQASEALIDTIFAAGERMDVKPADEAERLKTRQQLALLLKALTARDLWDLSEYYAIVNEENEAVLKAIDYLSGNQIIQ